jgi:hypothetical protein
MYQRAEEPMEHHDADTTRVEQRPTPSRGLSTADLAGTQPSREDVTPSTGQPSDVTPMTRPGQDIRPVGDEHTAMEHDEYPAMFKQEETERFRSRWTDIQAGFVDEPRHAVEQADGLVADTIKRLAEVFADERGHLEEQWSRGEDVSTEDLRLGLQRYRSFFDRLLSV